MPTAASLRDSTQIEVEYVVVAPLLEAIEDRYMVTIRREGRGCRIIGSPVEIKRVGTFLVRNGVALP